MRGEDWPCAVKDCCSLRTQTRSVTAAISICKWNRTLKANDPAKTILQPKNNLECGVKILVNQTIVQHKPLLTRSGYWSTLQPDGPSYRVFAKQMARRYRHQPNGVQIP